MLGLRRERPRRVSRPLSQAPDIGTVHGWDSLSYSPTPRIGDAWLDLDTELKERLRAVLENPQRPLTEGELRTLADKGRACTLILHGELERLERRLRVLDSDPDTSLGAIADAFRRVNDFRAHVGELDGLLAAFAGRAREVRTSWRQHVGARKPSESEAPQPRI